MWGGAPRSGSRGLAAFGGGVAPLGREAAALPWIPLAAVVTKLSAVAALPPVGAEPPALGRPEPLAGAGVVSVLQELIQRFLCLDQPRFLGIRGNAWHCEGGLLLGLQTTLL